MKTTTGSMSRLWGKLPMKLLWIALETIPAGTFPTFPTFPRATPRQGRRRGMGGKEGMFPAMVPYSTIRFKMRTAEKSDGGHGYEPAQALQVARAAGIHIKIDGGHLLLEAAVEAPAAILDLLSRNKAGILTMLQPGPDGWSAED